jgi:hypothetical protein
MPDVKRMARVKAAKDTGAGNNGGKRAKWGVREREGIKGQAGDARRLIIHSH